MARRFRDEDEIGETLVKVGRTGGEIKEYSVEGDEPTVQDALDAAGITISKGERVRLNGDTADYDDEVNDGDIITISGKVSGGWAILAQLLN